MISVELRPHTGLMKKHDTAGNFLGTFEAILPQYQVYVKAEDALPFRYGYVGVKKGSPINALVVLPPEIVEEIKQEVNRLLVEKDIKDGERRIVNPTGIMQKQDKEQALDSEDDEEYE